MKTLSRTAHNKGLDVGRVLILHGSLSLLSIRKFVLFLSSKQVFQSFQ